MAANENLMVAFSEKPFCQIRVQSNHLFSQTEMILQVIVDYFRQCSEVIPAMRNGRRRSGRSPFLENLLRALWHS